MSSWKIRDFSEQQPWGHAQGSWPCQICSLVLGGQWIWVGVRNEGDQSCGSGDAGLSYFYCLINGGNDGVC